VNTIELILVVLLSVGFLTLIIMSIILVTLMLAIMKNLKRIAERAESATTSVAGIAETFGRKLGPLAASGVLGLIMKRFTGKNQKGGK
jgi:hypothetical protein